MCFISFGSIIGPIDVSDGTIFDVYLIYDCLNELFCKTISIHSKYARTKLHMGRTNPESLEKIIEAQRSASRKSYLFIFLAREVTRKCVSGYPTHLIPTAGAHGCH